MKHPAVAKTSEPKHITEPEDWLSDLCIGEEFVARDDVTAQIAIRSDMKVTVNDLKRPAALVQSIEWETSSIFSMELPNVI